MSSANDEKKRKGKNHTAAVEEQDHTAAAPADSPPPEQQEQQQQPPTKKGKSAPVLPWMRVPITIDPSDGTLLEEIPGLDPNLATALTDTGIEVLFPVQSVVWRETSGGTSLLHDICIAAPTGSGKTLAYTLPILHALHHRTVPTLRALVILPTRDLAMQVYGVLSKLCSVVGLSVVAACGAVSLTEEASLLVGSNTSTISTGVDIVVATPGRLVAHLSNTPGFSLHTVEYLVIDETDRLLRQSYQGWISTVMAALQHTNSTDSIDTNTVNTTTTSDTNNSSNKKNRRVVKFVVSATLTRDPAKIDKLELFAPRYIAMSSEDHRYKLPKGLEEAKLVVPAEKKPFALAALLMASSDVPTIVFTSSLEATHRLYLMLQALPTIGSSVAEYSSSVSPEARKLALHNFSTGSITILVSSDAMTRGMDLENVAHVVNYDAPVYVKTYVHRAGRAARANKAGSVLTLLRKEDVKHFKDILRKVDNAYVKDYHFVSPPSTSGGGTTAIATNKNKEDESDMEDDNKATTTKKQGPFWEDAVVKEHVSAALEVMVEALEKEREAIVASTKTRGGSGSGVDGQQHQQQQKENGRSKSYKKKRKLQGVPEFA